MNKLQQGRLNKLLDKQYRDFDSQVRTFKEIVQNKLNAGYELKTDEVLDIAALNKACKRMRLIRTKYLIAESEQYQNNRGSNPNIPEVKEYWEISNKIARKEYTKTLYAVVSDDSRWFDIPKLVYDYFKEKNA